MYSAQRVKEWMERASSPEYQKAYDVVARCIPKDSTHRYLEIACGTGELLKRVHQRGQYASLVGIDFSEVMLGNVKNSLSALGLDLPITDAARAASMGTNGSALVLDDLLDSELPDEFADTSIFIFPELGQSHVLDLTDGQLIGEFALRAGPVDPKYYVDLAITLRSDYHIARVTKKGGRIILAQYDISRGKKAEYDQARLEGLKIIWGIFGVEMEKFLFFESPGVWSDTVDASEGDPSLNDARKGYRISLMRKTTKTKPILVKGVS